jgi:hypothetical protein
MQVQSPEVITSGVGTPDTAAHRRPAESRKWFVLRTRERRERAVADRLGALGIEHFVPVAPAGPRADGAACVPLFKSYVFVRATPPERRVAEGIERLLGVIEVSDQAALVGELVQIRRAMDAGAPLEPSPLPESGFGARVLRGPLRGLKGVVRNRWCADRLVLRVRVPGCAASLRVSPEHLELLD